MALGLGLGVPFYRQRGYCAEYQAVYDSMTTKPSADVAEAQNTMVESLVDGGVWSLLDVFYLFAQEINSDGEALKNWCNPGTHDATLVNAPTFTSLEGFTGADTKYIETNFCPRTDTSNYALDDAAHGAYVRVADSGSNKFVYGVYSTAGDGGTDNILRLAVSSTEVLQGVNNELTQSTRSFAAAMWVQIRSNSNNYDLYENKTKDNITKTSSKIPDQDIVALARRTTSGDVGLYGEHQLSCLFFGGAITEAQENTLVDAIETYMDSNGKGVIS